MICQASQPQAVPPTNKKQFSRRVFSSCTCLAERNRSPRVVAQNAFQARQLHARAKEYLPDLPDLTESQRDVRVAIAKICSRFGDGYWIDIDNTKRWPIEFTSAIAKEGWL